MTENTQTKPLSESLAEQLGEDESTIQQKRETFYAWMKDRGKDHVTYEEMSVRTADNYLDRLDQLHRTAISMLDMESETDLTPEFADGLLMMFTKDAIVKHDGTPYSDSSKRKFSNALQKYFEWHFYTDRLSFEWKPRIKFSDGQHTSATKFTYEEMGQLLEAAKTYGKLPAYYETSPEERDRIRGLVAQRLGKPKESVNRDDWRRADQSSKFRSLVSVGHDAGLIPLEVTRAKVKWYKPDRGILKIPTDSAAKERNQCEISLSDESCEWMSEWIRERRHLEKYDGSNKLWLNRNGNPYSSASLCNLIEKLCKKVGIKTEDRPVRWYSLRHTVGQHIESDGSLNQTNDQLRHDTVETTINTYGDSPAEERKQTLNKTRAKLKRAAEDSDYNPYDEQEESVDITQSEQNTSDPEHAVTKRSGGDVHVDAAFSDTTQNRVDIAQQVLSDGNYAEE